MTKHLAIFTELAITQILTGQKTVETRFSQKRIVPFGVVSSGDTVFMKLSGHDICGQFKVKKVVSFENLDSNDWAVIKKSYGKELSIGEEALDEKYFEARKFAKYGTVLFIDQVEQLITSPFTFKKKDRRGWVVL